MKPSYGQLNDDLQEIKCIQTKWRIQKRDIEGKSEVKKLQLLVTEEYNPDFQLPDVFITTRQIHKSIKSPTYQRKKQCFSFDRSAQSMRQSKYERNLDIQTLETNYKKFKQIGCIFRESPRKNPLLSTSYETQKQVFYKIDGVNFPYNLYTMHQKRKEKLEDIYKNATCQNSNQKIKEFEEQNANDIIKKQKENRSREYVSRSFLDNAYFSILSANKVCKTRVKRSIQSQFPKESRFHQF